MPKRDSSGRLKRRGATTGADLEGFTYTDEQQRAILDELRPLQSGVTETEIIASVTLAARHAQAQALLVEDRPSAREMSKQLEQLSSAIGALDLHCRSYLDTYLRDAQLGALHRIEAVVVRLALVVRRRLRPEAEPFEPDEFAMLPAPPPIDWPEIDGFRPRARSREQAAERFVQRLAEIYRQSTGKTPSRRSNRGIGNESSFYGFVRAAIEPPKIAQLPPHGLDSLIRRAVTESRVIPLRAV